MTRRPMWEKSLSPGLEQEAEIKSECDEIPPVQWHKLFHLGTYSLGILGCTDYPSTVHKSNLQYV